MTATSLEQYLDLPIEIAPSRPETRRSFPLIGWVGATILALFAAVAVAAPYLTPYGPLELAGRPLLSPNGDHWLGTNDVGQDIFTEVLHGTRVSLAVAVGTAVLVVTMAAIFGSLAGYVGGRFDALAMRLVDVFLTIPRLPLLVLLAAYAGTSVVEVIVIISLISWPIPTRLVRAEVLSVRSRRHIDAARSFGARTAYTIRRHIIPAATPILITSAAAQAGRGVTMEAGLAFIGLGDPVRRSWGSILRAATTFPGIYFGEFWKWWILPTGLALTLLVLAFTLLGQGLETSANPRTERHG